MKNFISVSILFSLAFAFSAFRPTTAKFENLPDLVVVGVQPNCQVPELFVTVKNSGTEVSAETLGNAYPTDALSQKCLKKQNFKIKKLNPGESVRIRIALNNSKGCYCRNGNTVISGGMDFKVAVDSPQTVVESDENNNGFLFHYQQ